MARWAAGAKWGEAPAPDGQRDMPLALSLSEWLDRSVPAEATEAVLEKTRPPAAERFGSCLGATAA